LLGRDFCIHSPDESQGQVFCTSNYGDRSAENELPAGTVSIDDGQPCLLEDDLCQADARPNRKPKNNEGRSPAGHAGAGIHKGNQRVKNNSADESTDRSADDSVAQLRGRPVLDPVNDADCDSHQEPANSPGQPAEPLKSAQLENEVAENTSDRATHSSPSKSERCAAR